MRRLLGLLAIFLLLGAGLWLLLGPAHERSKRPSIAAAAGVRVIGVSDIWVFTGPQKISWLDDSTVVFVGAPRGSDRSLRPSNLYVWRLGGEPSVYAAGQWPRDGGYACADSGEIAYSVSPERKADNEGLLVKKGRMGDEKIALLAPPINDNDFWLKKLQVNGGVSVSGKRCDYFTHDYFNNHWWIANHARSEVIDFGVQGIKFSEITVFKINDISNKVSKIKSIMTSGNSIIPSCTETPAWNNSFILFNCYSEAWELPEIKIIQVDPVLGESTQVIQTRPELRSADIVPYRDGYLVVNNDAGIQDRGGLFIVRSGRPEKVLTGSYLAAAVSPSGCKVALTEFEPGPDSYSHLKVVEVCKSREAL